METELILLGILFLIMCVMDYAEWREELRDMHNDDDDDDTSET